MNADRKQVSPRWTGWAWWTGVDGVEAVDGARGESWPGMVWLARRPVEE